MGRANDEIVDFFDATLDLLKKAQGYRLRVHDVDGNPQGIVRGEEAGRRSPMPQSLRMPVPPRSVRGIADGPGHELQRSSRRGRPLARAPE
jgi:hypothetical protein